MGEIKEAYKYGLIPEEMLKEYLTNKISREKFAAISIKLCEAILGRYIDYLDIKDTHFTDCYYLDSQYKKYIGAAYDL